MNQNATTEIAIEFGKPEPAAGSDSEKDAWGYAKELRVLGQALEAHQLCTVDIEIESGVYFVRGKANIPQSSRVSVAKLIRDHIFGPYGAKQSEDIKLRYTANEIKQLDGEGRAKRKDSSKTPDPHSLSQILRGAGSYLDKRQTSLVGITIRDGWVTLRYRTVEGALEQAKQDIEYFFNYWVKMYLRRKNRPQPPAQKNPTLIVTWEGIKRRNSSY